MPLSSGGVFHFFLLKSSWFNTPEQAPGILYFSHSNTKFVVPKFTPKLMFGTNHRKPKQANLDFSLAKKV
jgi:hypothetical protein